MGLKAMANDRRPFAMMNFVGLDLDFADQAVTQKCFDIPPVDRDRLNAHPGYKGSYVWARVEDVFSKLY
ncbi:hypothetical protein TNCV_2481341 [Trichonephila clavipes]|nr:hypothetical protein TNCV_2481341 [Trichonephila clavipes]